MKLRVLLCVLLAGVLVAADEPKDDKGKGKKSSEAPADAGIKQKY